MLRSSRVEMLINGVALGHLTDLTLDWRVVHRVVLVQRAMLAV